MTDINDIIKRLRQGASIGTPNPAMVPLHYEWLAADEIERLRTALRLIQEMPVPNQDDMLSHNMRAIARDALAE